MTTGFTNPAFDLLKRNILGFSYIETFGDKADYRNKTLGGANINWLMDRNQSVFSIEEDITTDPLKTFNQINNIVQKQWVTRNMRKDLELNLIGFLPRTPEDAIGLIKSQIVSNLEKYISQGNIGNYQDNDGNIREIDPATDVIVEQDPNNPVNYNFMYGYYLRNILKRLFGYFAVNTNTFNIS